MGFVPVLFAPGYVFISALFPGRDELDGFERLALSIGLSICIAVFIGQGLNYAHLVHQAEIDTFIIICFHIDLRGHNRVSKEPM